MGVVGDLSFRERFVRRFPELSEFKRPRVYPSQCFSTRFRNSSSMLWEWLEEEEPMMSLGWRLVFLAELELNLRFIYL